MKEELSKPTFLPPVRSGHTKTIEEERREDLENYRIAENSEPVDMLPKMPLKEELLTEEVVHDVATAEAQAGKIHLPTVLPIKTIRLDVDNFSAFYQRKFYRVKLDYDLYFEVNADSEKECVDKIVNFIESELKGMLSEAPKEELVSGGKNNSCLTVKKNEMVIEEFIPKSKHEEISEFDR